MKLFDRLNEIKDTGVQQYAQNITKQYPDLPVSSIGRDPQKNAAVGGVKNSFHLSSRAVDIPLPKNDPRLPGMIAQAKEAGLDPLYHRGHLHIEPGGKPVALKTAQPMQMLSQAPAFQQQPQQEQQQGYNIDPRSLVGSPPQAMGGKMQALLSVLGGIGALGGTGANVIGAIKGTGSPGDAALAQSSGLFGMLGKQQTDQEEYRKRLELAQTLPPELAVQALAPAALASYIGERTKPISKKDQLAMDKTQAEINNMRTPEEEAAAKLKGEKDLADYKAGIEAKSGKTKPLSGDASKLLAVARGGIEQLSRLSEAYKNTNTFGRVNALVMPGGGIFKDSRELSTVAGDIADRITRLRTGATVSDAEEKRFRGLLPSPLNSPATNQKNMDQLLKEFQRVEHSITIGESGGATPEAPTGVEGYSQGADGVWRKNK